MVISSVVGRRRLERGSSASFRCAVGTQVVCWRMRKYNVHNSVDRRRLRAEIHYIAPIWSVKRAMARGVTALWLPSGILRPEKHVYLYALAPLLTGLFGEWWRRIRRASSTPQFRTITALSRYTAGRGASGCGFGPGRLVLDSVRLPNIMCLLFCIRNVVTKMTLYAELLRYELGARRLSGPACV